MQTRFVLKPLAGLKDWHRILRRIANARKHQASRESDW